MIWTPVGTEKPRSGDIETMAYITSRFLSMLSFFHCIIPESQRSKILPDSLCDQILSKGAVGKLLKTVGRMWRVSHPDKKIRKLKTKKAKKKEEPLALWYMTENNPMGMAGGTETKQLFAILTSDLLSSLCEHANPRTVFMESNEVLSHF